MTFIDTHTHLYMEQFDEDRRQAVMRADLAGVKLQLMPNVDSGTIGDMMAVARDFPGTCLPMMALHPTSVKPGFETELELVEHWLGKEQFVAIGETGIDLYWDKSFLEEQKQSLHRHIQLALQHQLPLVLHARKSLNEIFGVLADYRGSGLKGVFHCFPGSVQEAERALGFGFLLGIGGVVTYKNSSMAAVVEEFGLQHLVLETDSPYLPPIPYRGKRNESAYIPAIAEKVAALTGRPLAEVAMVTTNNARELFRVRL
jgi:TatD DNase family protein